MMQRSRQTSRAFTLLEVLVAMAMVAVLTASLYASLHIAFTARRSATERLDTIRSARLTMDAIGRDLLAATPPTGVLTGAFEGTASSGTGSPGAPGDTVTFYCANRASRTPGTTGDIQQVTLSLVMDSNNSQTGQLVRQVQTNLLALVQEDPVSQVLCRNVSSFNIRYFDGTTWTDTWDSSANNNQLPNAIEVTLAIAPAEGSPANAPPCRLVRQFVPPCAPPPITSGLPATSSTPGQRTP